MLRCPPRLHHSSRSRVWNSNFIWNIFINIARYRKEICNLIRAFKRLLTIAVRACFFLLLSATQEKCHDLVEIWLKSHVNLVQICINAFFCPEGSEHDTASRGRSGLTVWANLIFTLIMIINIFLSLLVIFVCFWILKLATKTIRRGFSWKHKINKKKNNSFTSQLIGHFFFN